MSKIDAIIEKSILFVEERNYKSYDLFDILESSLIDKTTSFSPLMRRIAIQLNKNFIFNIRPLLGYEPILHTKAVSDMLSVYTMLYRERKDECWKNKADEMYDLLMLKSLHFGGGIGWGLNFPYTTRFVNAKRETPNLYNTLNSVHSILDYYEISNKVEIKDIVLKVLKFMFDYLGYVPIDQQTGWFRYYPEQITPNFNVNATSASFFARINHLFTEELVSKNIIDSLLSFLIENQNENGSWYYAMSDNGKWIDGYHTGFILDALLYLDEINYDFQLFQSLERGISFYIHNLFTKDNIPKFFHDKIYPVEAQNCAQAILTLTKCINQKKNIKISFVESVVSNVLRHLYNEKGYFYYKKDTLFTNKQIYFRWSQTPMISALQHFRKTQKNFD